MAVDIRKGSPTFGDHVAVELSEENKRQLFIPRGFAHGFIVLSEFAIFSYKVDNFYSSRQDRGLAFNDPKLNIDWVLSRDEVKLSQKDSEQPLLNEIETFEYGINLYA